MFLHETSSDIVSEQNVTSGKYSINSTRSWSNEFAPRNVYSLYKKLKTFQVDIEKISTRDEENHMCTLME